MPRVRHDVDLGSGGPMIVPTQSGSYPDEIILAGKGGTPCDLWTGGRYSPLPCVPSSTATTWATTMPHKIKFRRRSRVHPLATGRTRHTFLLDPQITFISLELRRIRA